MVEIISIPGVMTREMIKNYEGEKVYAPADELRKATEKRSVIPIVMFRDREHTDVEPPESDVLGWARLNYQDGKVKTNLAFVPEFMTDTQLDMLATLEKDNLSPAFHMKKVKEKGAFKGQPYDAKQTEIEWGHVAVVTTGRCDLQHGCGLYMDSFDALEEYDDSLKECVARKISECAHAHPEWPHDKCIAVAFSICREGKDVSDRDSSEVISEGHPNKGRVDTMSEEQLKQKQNEIESLQAKITAFEAREQESLVEQVAEKFKIAKDSLKEKSSDVLKSLLEMDVKLPVGQDTGDQKDADKNKSKTEEKDAEYEPGLTITVGYDYAKGLGMKHAAIRKKVR